MVTALDEATEFPLGVEVEVQISVLHVQVVGEAYSRLDGVELYEGHRLIGVGAFIDHER